MIANIYRKGPPHMTVAVEVRVHGNPQARMTRDGYTRRGGSPTAYQIRIPGERRWRRVYVVQFSNAGTTFVKTKADPFLVVGLFA